MTTVEITRFRVPAARADALLAARPAMVRERLLEYFGREFEFVRTSLFSDTPGLNRKNAADALATYS